MRRHLVVGRCATCGSTKARGASCWWLLAITDPGWEVSVLGHYARKSDAELTLRRHLVTSQ